MVLNPLLTTLLACLDVNKHMTYPALAGSNQAESVLLIKINISKYIVYLTFDTVSFFRCFLLDMTICIALAWHCNALQDYNKFALLWSEAQKKIAYSYPKVT